MRLSHNPKKVHKLGLNHIAIYLEVIQNSGLIMKSNTSNLYFGSFVDVDFAGLFAIEDKL